MSRTSWLVAMMGVWGVTACADPNPPIAPSPVPSAPLPEPRLPASLDDPDVGNACREQVAGLEEWLTSIEHAGLPLALSLLDEGTKLVERSGPVAREAAPLVHLTSEAIYLDGVPVGGAAGAEAGETAEGVETPAPDEGASLRAELTQLIELRRSMMPESPFIQSPRCYLAVDRSVRWERVVGVVEQARLAGVERVTLLFRDPTRSIPAPPPSPIDREIDRMQRGTQLRRQQITAELLAYVYQDCPQGLKVIASMGVNPVADFKQVILGDFPAAIGACSCAPDDASVKALHWAIFGNPRPTSGVTVRLAVGSSAEGGATAVALPADQPWSEAHATLAQHGADEDDDATPLLRLDVAPESSRSSAPSGGRKPAGSSSKGDRKTPAAP